jgi:hypothetical protein
MIKPSPAQCSVRRSSNGNFAPPPGAESRAKRAETRCESDAAMRRHRLNACGKRKREKAQRELVRFMANK